MFWWKITSAYVTTEAFLFVKIDYGEIFFIAAAVIIIPGSHLGNTAEASMSKKVLLDQGRIQTRPWLDKQT